MNLKAVVLTGLAGLVALTPLAPGPVQAQYGQKSGYSKTDLGSKIHPTSQLDAQLLEKNPMANIAIVYHRQREDGGVDVQNVGVTSVYMDGTRQEFNVPYRLLRSHLEFTNVQLRDMLDKSTVQGQPGPKSARTAEWGKFYTSIGVMDAAAGIRAYFQMKEGVSVDPNSYKVTQKRSISGLNRSFDGFVPKEGGMRLVFEPKR